ncbi:MAG: DUF1573 domain-containing protein [Planctomycetota bacterium]
MSSARPVPFLYAPLLVLALGGCGTRPAAEAAPRGLVVLPSEPGAGPPLPEGVLPRDNFHYLGEVPDGEIVEDVFRLRNTAEVPVAITRMTGGCGCAQLSVSFTRPDGEVVRGLSSRSGAEKLLEIPPGVEADFLLRIDTRGIQLKNQPKSVSARLTTDAPATRFLALETSVVPFAPFQTNPATLNFGRIPMSAGAERSLDVVPIADRGHRITGIAETPPGMEVELAHEVRFEIPVWVVTARLLPPLSRGLHTGRIRLATATAGGEPYRPVEIPFRAEAVEDVQVDNRLVFRVAPGDSGSAGARVEIYSLLAGQRLRIVGAELAPEHREDLALEWEPREPDAEGRSERWFLALRPRRPFPAETVLIGTAVVALDDPQTPRVEVSYAVHVAR